jgi:hypothetical protein
MLARCIFDCVILIKVKDMLVLIIMNLDEYTKEQLWQLIVETVHGSVMYPTHKAYTRNSILPQKAEISANELSEMLEMSLGEALVILSELSDEHKLPA